MPLDYKIAESTLANGLRVIVSEDHSVPNVTVNLWVNVGSRHEVEGRTGFAHLFEHLMFQGSANVASGEHLLPLAAHSLTSRYPLRRTLDDTATLTSALLG